MATGLRNINGSRTVIDVLNNLGHCIDYDKTCQIETCTSNKNSKIANDETVLLFKPRDETCIVPTFFGVDDFDVTIESQKGGGSVNTKHLIAFQETDGNSVPVTSNVTVEKSTKRQLNFETSETKTHNPIINKKLSCALLPDENVSHEESYFTVKYFMWLTMRKQNIMNQFSKRNDQIVPNFSCNKKHTRWLVFTSKIF